MQSIKMSDELLSDLQTALISTNLSWFRDESGQRFLELLGYDNPRE